MYQELKKQYDSLDLEDKNALLIYKSRLFKFINNIDNILLNKQVYDRFKQHYEEDKTLICSPENMVARYSIFQNINFESYDLFLESIKQVKNKIMSLKNKIYLPQDTIVYRATTVKSKEDMKHIANSNLISTSLSIEQTDKFYTYDGINVLYQIKLKKGTPCLVIPYSIEIHDINEKGVLKVKEKDFQSEIVLFKDELDFIMKDSKYLEEENITIVKIETEPIKQNIR